MISFKIYLFKGNTLSLFIPKARKDMSGNYSVKVSNKRGCEECSCELTIGKYALTKCDTHAFHLKTGQKDKRVQRNPCGLKHVKELFVTGKLMKLNRCWTNCYHGCIH